MFRLTVYLKSGTEINSWICESIQEVQDYMKVLLKPSVYGTRDFYIETKTI